MRCRLAGKVIRPGPAGFPWLSTMSQTWVSLLFGVRRIHRSQPGPLRIWNTGGWYRGKSTVRRAFSLTGSNTGCPMNSCGMAFWSQCSLSSAVISNRSRSSNNTVDLRVPSKSRILTCVSGPCHSTTPSAMGAHRACRRIGSVKGETGTFQLGDDSRAAGAETL